MFKTYSIKDQDFESKILQKLVIRIGEILKIKHQIHYGKQVPYTFETIAYMSFGFILKMKIYNKLSKYDFWILSLDNLNYKWLVEYFTLHKIQVKKSFQYFSKSIVLDSDDFISIFGNHPDQILEKISQKERIIVNYILLNSVKVGEILKEIQTDKNNELILHIVKTAPYSFVNKKFVEYLGSRLCSISFEFLYYTKINYFMRISVSEHETLNNCTIILLGFYEKLINENYLKFHYNEYSSFLTDKRIIEQKHEIFKNIFSDTDKLKKGVLKYLELNVLSVDGNFILFGSLEKFLDILSPK